MNTYSFKIYDCHEKQTFNDDGSFTCVPFDYWFKFELTIVLEDVWITTFREYTLFDSDNNPITECTRVYLSDGSVVFAVLKYDTFKANFIDKYLPLLNSSKENDN